jgi:DNA polymerase III alpha subunit
VCYLLGISHIDPVRERMCLSRFMNSLRNDLPDVDLDFPHKMRDDIFHR